MDANAAYEHRDEVQILDVREPANRAGYRAENLDGGLQAWARAGLPFVAEDGHEPRVA